eukprot:scaffold13688_cov157-Skeletonema_marinoi.AAC.1
MNDKTSYKNLNQSVARTHIPSLERPTGYRFGQNIVTFYILSGLKTGGNILTLQPVIDSISS